MEPLDSGSIQLELKYCERCGGLGLRPQGSDLVFCAACTIAVSALTRVRGLPIHYIRHPRLAVLRGLKPHSGVKEVTRERRSPAGYF